MKESIGRDGAAWRGSERFEHPGLPEYIRRVVEMARNNFTNDEIEEEHDISWRSLDQYIHRARKHYGVEVPYMQVRFLRKEAEIIPFNRNKWSNKPSGGKRKRNRRGVGRVDNSERNKEILELARKNSFAVVAAMLAPKHPAITRQIVSGVVGRASRAKKKAAQSRGGLSLGS